MMKVALALLTCVAVASVLAACSGGGGDTEPSPTPSVPPTDTPAPQTDVPGRPNDFVDYPGLVAIYLTQNGDSVLGSPCLTDLIAEWDMPEPNVPLTPDQRCLVGNMDGDEGQEVVVVFTGEPEGDNAFAFLVSNTVIFDDTPEGYVASFESYDADQPAELDAQRIVAIADVTGNDEGNLIFTSTTCGAHTCTTTVHALYAPIRAQMPQPGTVYAKLAPSADPVAMETADVSVEDRTGDGVPDIVLHGGTIGSVGAGPQRTRTEVYSWDGDQFALVETTYGPSDLLYFAILDADTLFLQGDYDDAVAAYLAAVEDDTLIESNHFEKQNERPELTAYALFRAGLAQLASGDEDRGLGTMQRAVDGFGDTLNAGLAESFLASYEARANVSSACFAVRDYIDASPAHTADAFQLFWDFGYANPPFVKEDVCPL